MALHWPCLISYMSANKKNLENNTNTHCVLTTLVIILSVKWYITYSQGNKYNLLDCLRVQNSFSFFPPLLLYRNCSDRVVMLEASVETYKRKLENLGDLKRQMKLLEENNMTYMQNTVSLEEELRKANAARAQLETYKRQASDLQI